MSDRRPPRFPYVAALLCAACLGAAAWTWMRYSYCWDITEWTLEEHAGARGDWPEGAYVSVTGTVMVVLDAPADLGFGVVSLMWGKEPPLGCQDIQVADPSVFTEGSQGTVKGRADLEYDEAQGTLDYDYLDTTTSRFHGASIAGLVVGAMGVFVFTVAFRHWLKERASASAA